MIPAYNCEDTLERAVRSVLCQEGVSLEVLIVDDGSGDGTPALIRRLEEEDERVRGFRLEKNLGVSAARNRGIREARGNWIFTLDDDDYIDEDMLSDMLGQLGKDDSDTCIVGFRMVWPGGKQQEFLPQVYGYYLKKEFLLEAFPELYDSHLISTHSNKLYRTELLKKEGIFYNEELEVNEDIDFCFRYLARCRRVSLLPRAYMNYVQSAVGASLITTFRENGVRGAILNYTAVRDLYRGLKDSPAFGHMKIRMFEHICSFAGLMYYRSDYTRKERMKTLKELAGDPDFRELLSALPDSNRKNRIAAFLLHRGMTRTYDLLCVFLYRNLKRSGA